MVAIKDDNVLLVDRRYADRESVDHEALGLFPGAEDALDCQVLDISETGAKLHLSGVDIVPKRFKLFVPETGFLYECEMAWRNSQEMGVSFHSKAKL